MMRLESSNRRRLGFGGALLALATVLRAGQAQAQPAAATPPPSQGTVTPATPADEEAATRFKRGLQLFDEGDYTLALVEFERAYQIAPNYRALYNIALVDTQLGRYADASRTFDQYLRDGGDAIPAARRAEVQNTLASLRVRTATLEVSTNVSGAEVSLDGKPLDASLLRTPMLIDAGEHSLRATAPGYSPGFKTLTLAGADQTSVRLDLVALPSQKATPETPTERGRSLFWPGFVATGVFAAGAIVSGAVMLDARSRLSQQQNSVGSTESLRSNTANEVNGAALAADILTGLAVVSGGVSLYLSLRVDHSPKPLAVTISPQRVSFSGTF
jgi:tetratricopeptide (TPR) repeat protein